jgi:pimeloyl-ACP methyl ester carboxylesterase
MSEDEPRDEWFETVAGKGSERLRLHARHWGSQGSPTLVLLHGAGSNAHWWDHVAPHLARNHHVVALDFRGHGDSDYPETLIKGAFSNDLEALLEHLATPDAILMGHSLGAHVALWHAANREGTPAMVLIDLARGASPSRQRATKLALTLRRTYKSAQQAVLRFRFLPGAARAEESLRASIAGHSVRQEPDGRYGFKFDPRWFGVPSRERPDLSRVGCPTLLLRGAESNLLTEKGAQEVARAIPHCRLVTIPHAGHHVHIDQPDAVMNEVSGFLTERR